MPNRSWFRSSHRGAEVQAFLGTLGCISNATTSLDDTTFLAQCPANRAGEMLELHLGLLDGDFSGAWDAALPNEARTLIQEERTRSDGLLRPLFRAALMGLFPDKHGYKASTVDGSDAMAIEPSLVRRWVAKFYRPSSAILVVGGAISASELIDALVQHGDPRIFHPDATRAHLRE